MKYYTQFYTKNHNNKIIECLGSDGVFILDGRNNLNTMVADSIDRINVLKNIMPYIIGFSINKGDFKRSSIIYKSVNIRKIT